MDKVALWLSLVGVNRPMIHTQRYLNIVVIILEGGDRGGAVG